MTLAWIVRDVTNVYELTKYDPPNFLYRDIAKRNSDSRTHLNWTGSISNRIIWTKYSEPVQGLFGYIFQTRGVPSSFPTTGSKRAIVKL